MKYIITALLIACIHSLTAQTNKDWQIHLSYSDAEGVEELNEHVYVLANGALYSYGKEDNELRFYSKLNGLSDTDISIIRYNTNTRTLVIVYSNGNIDLFDEDGITNMPSLKNASNIQSKSVNDIYNYNNYAYLATDFGIVAINLSKKEISETYRLNTIVYSACIFNEKIWASTDKGLLAAPTSANLIDINNWEAESLSNTEITDKEITRIRSFNNQLIFYVKNESLYYMNPEGAVKALIKQDGLQDFRIQANQLLAYTSGSLFIFNSTNGEYNRVNVGEINSIASLKEDGKYWIASGENGLTGIQKSGENEFSQFVSDLYIDCPKRNYNAFMTVSDGKLLVAGGGRTSARLWIPGTFMAYQDDKWHNFNELKANLEIAKLIGDYSRDFMGIAVHPDDEDHYFIATYGEGIIELNDDEFVNLHHYDNSTLVSAIEGNPSYVRIGSVCFDTDKNLWATNCLAQSPVNVLKANGEWVSLFYPQINKADEIDKILITSKGHKWINVPYDNAGIFVLDDNGTIDDVSDDRFNFFSSFKDVQSSSGGRISPGQFLSMAEDHNGVMWLGTNIGLLRCGVPSHAIENPEQLSCSRLVRDEEAYFLSGESVTAIAVDQDNQKWIGTGSSGIFLINEDGTETIDNFTAENSPLLSNTIQSIAVNDKTGEVFFGTEKGIVSYQSGVVKGQAKLSNVYAYPNPVRPEYNDKVTITGLTNNTTVKITDINGNIIHQGKASGRDFVWNCRNHKSDRVATGVYLVLASTPEAAESVVAKIAVVK